LLGFEYSFFISVNFDLIGEKMGSNKGLIFMFLSSTFFRGSDFALGQQLRHTSTVGYGKVDG